MKRFLFLFLLTLTFHQSVLAQCNVGPYTVSSNVTITSSCIITGDLTILNGGTLNVDFTGAGADTFVVRGNILLQGNALLWVHADSGSTGKQFIVSSSFKGQRNITTRDSSEIKLENIEFSAQELPLVYISYDVNLNAYNKSIIYVNNCRLNTQISWILCNLKNKSSLIGYGSDQVPTETYLQDTAQITLHGPATKAGIWLTFQSITGTLNLPPDQAIPYSWQIGRGFGGLATQWYLELDTANPGIGVQILPSAKMTINGTGLPATGELKVALLFADGTDTIQNLQVGLQNTTVDDGINGSVTLNNVNLGPIAWQIYALMNENLFIKKSIVNEIGIAGPSNVTVDSSLLQLAALAAVGAGGSTMTINNSEIWNQEITAFNSSHTTLNNCKVTGSVFSTTDTSSRITVNGGCFFQNPAGCTQNNMVNIATGQPYCNPFIPAGFPQNLTPSTVTFNGVNYNCATGINEMGNANSFQIFPNPATETLNVFFPDNLKTQFQIFNTMGMLLKEISPAQSLQIDISDLSSGLYFIHVKNKANQTQKFIKL